MQTEFLTARDLKRDILDGVPEACRAGVARFFNEVDESILARADRLPHESEGK